MTSRLQFLEFGGVADHTADSHMMMTSLPRMANAREKKRMLCINSAYEQLRKCVPTFPYERRLSKIDTLNLAISYIHLLRAVLASDLDPVDYILYMLQKFHAEAGNNSTPMKNHICSAWNTDGEF